MPGLGFELCPDDEELEELVSEESFRLLNSSLHLFEQNILEEAHFVIQPEGGFEALIGPEPLDPYPVFPQLVQLNS